MNVRILCRVCSPILVLWEICENFHPTKISIFTVLYINISIMHDAPIGPVPLIFLMAKWDRSLVCNLYSCVKIRGGFHEASCR